MKDDFKNAALNPGSLLVFTSDIDPFFWKSVVLLLANDQRGTYGVQINKLDYDYSYDNFVKREKIDLLKPQGAESRVFLSGGPSAEVTEKNGKTVYSPRLVTIFEDGDGKVSFVDSTSREQFKKSKEIEASGSRAVRLIINYAGWQPGQLQAEISAGAWRVLPPDPDLVFRTPREEIFPKAAEKAGLHPDVIRYLVDPNGLREEKGGFKETQEYLKSIWPKVPKQQASGKP